MNSLTMRCAALALCATTLAACGGSSGGSIPLSGQISGLNRAGLVLTNKGKDFAVPDSASTFQFTDLVASDSEFEILVKTNPEGQVCTPSNNKGRANYYSYTQTIITCTTDPYTLSGTVTGLTNTGLVLANGSLTVAVAAGAKSFTFGKTVPNKQSYGVTVLSQPTGQTCTVQNGSGIMPIGDKNDVTITCI
ncbi:hypothetical protein GCM10027277_14630 [Pseudoduganella ginsengisoli]|uniref:Lipoprotein n=1 Tax=Pseudoduganella ginsengisoli TaxID=1462440 RepID=A0A6L6PVM8_9BURK|nr:hypothetical protein [Pseudoduganella ginsengisoli]MTW01276.1 hypothetical protein [Pseudoduganella ginsengisoli]